jgi:hypothetical protein
MESGPTQADRTARSHGGRDDADSDGVYNGYTLLSLVEDSRKPRGMVSPWLEEEQMSQTEAKADGGTVVVSARVPVETASELARLAREGDRSVSREVGRVLRRYVQEHAVPERDEGAR